MRLVLLVVAMGCAGVLVGMGRPVPPTEMPPLALDPAAVARVLARERVQAAKAPVDGPAARLRDAYYAVGLAESGSGETRGESSRRTAEVGGALLEVRKQKNATALLTALRAQAAESLVAALTGQGSDRSRRQLLGSLPQMLERYHLAHEGRQVAPDFVVRVLFEARWNAAVRLPMTFAFAPVQLQAYWGWLAFEGEGVDLAERQKALDAYAAAGGRHVDEARGVLAYRARHFAAAAKAFRKAYAEGGNVRLRNHALAAEAAAAGGG